MATITKETDPADDPVNPKHYKSGDIECIEAIEAALGPEGFRAFLRGTIIKYAWRGPHKGCEALDNDKLNWYADRLAKSIKETKNG